MKVLLLGATGLLGHNVLRRLVDTGQEAVCLVRRAEGIKLDYGHWQTIVGSPLDETSLRDAATGCDAVINCVGATNMGMLRREDYARVNVGVPTLLAAMVRRGEVSRVVHVSTVNTVGPGTPEHPADERGIMSADEAENWYAATKAEGEKVLLEAAREQREAHVVILNPGYMVGPYDVRPSSGALLSAAYRKPLMAAPRGGKAFVAVGDVAAAAVTALTRGESGGRYLLTNRAAEMTFARFFAEQAATMGYRQHCIELPDWLVRAAGRMGDALRALHIPTALSSRNVALLLMEEHYDNSRARADLGLAETPIGQAIGHYFAWREMGW